jgi:hypothetical protein
VQLTVENLGIAPVDLSGMTYGIAHDGGGYQALGDCSTVTLQPGESVLCDYVNAGGYGSGLGTHTVAAVLDIYGIVDELDETNNTGILGFTVIVPTPYEPGDLTGDGDVDRDDLNVIIAARNQPTSGANDPRDLDGDGKITALDARKIVLLCTRPRCATE